MAATTATCCLEYVHYTPLQLPELHRIKANPIIADHTWPFAFCRCQHWGSLRSLAGEQASVLSPLQAAQLEPLAPPPLQRVIDTASRQPRPLVMGASLRELVSLQILSCLCSLSDMNIYLSHMQLLVH